MAEEAYLSREDVMKLLKVDEAKLENLIKQGKLKSNGEGKFKEDDIVNYMTEEPPEIKKEEASEAKEEEIVEIKEERVEEKPEAVIEEPSLLSPEPEKLSEEGKVPSLGEEKPIRIEPKKPRPSPLEETVEIPRIKEEYPEEGIEIIEPGEEVRPEEKPKKEVKERIYIPPARPAQAEALPPVEKEKKVSRFFSILFILSLIFILSAIGILLLPILKVPIPTFLKPALQFANKIFKL